MIDNLWIAICFCFAFSLGLYIWVWQVVSSRKELLNQFERFLELQIMHNSKVNERVYALECRSKFKQVK